MAVCEDNKGIMTGRAITLELADGCADTVPVGAEWQYLGPMTSKDLDFSPSTVTSEADDSGGYVVSLVTTSDLTISGEGEVRENDKSDEYGIHRLINYYNTEVKARRQPTVWVRRTMGATVITMYAVLTVLSTSGGTNDIVTFSVEFHPADSDTVSVESVIDLTASIPATATAATGATLTIGPAVVNGGIAPYTYVWKKGGVIVSGQTAATFSKTNAVSGDAGTYIVEVTDAATTPDIAASNGCVVTIS